MYIFSTSCNRQPAFALAALLPPADTATVLAKAARLDLEATLHQNEGRTWHADRLSQLAFELRCRALGMQA